MDKIRIVFQVCLNNFRKWPTNPRLYVLGLLMILFVKIVDDPIKAFVIATGVPVTPYAFPFLINGWYSVLMFMFGVVLLFCDAPFADEHQPYTLIRSGKRLWLLGQILYVFVASAVYFLFIIFLSIAFLMPHVLFSADWGKVWMTLARTTAGGQFSLSYPVPLRILSSYHPINAMALCFFLCWMVGSFLGLLMYLWNRHLNRIVGALVAAILVSLEIIVYFNEYWLAYYSPISWTSLYLLDPYNISTNPSVTYAVTGILIINAVLIVLLFILDPKKDVEVLEQI